MSNYPTGGDTDQYGNPIGHTRGGAGAGYGGGLMEKIKAMMPGGHKDQHSSQPGYEKKGIMEKIKEKIPGGHTQPGYGTTTTTAGGGAGYGHPHEKKGMMEKIMEKLPGQHK